MEEKHAIMQLLCAAHGFSLVNHYITQAVSSEGDLVGRVAGIIAFFNRSPQRLEHLRDNLALSDKKIMKFVPISRTRFSFMTGVMLRVIRLRQASQKAIITIKSGMTPEKDTADFKYEP